MSKKATKNREGANQTEKALNDAVAAANHVLSGVLAAAVARTPATTGRSNIGKKKKDERKMEKRKTIRFNLYALPILTYCSFKETSIR